jgi:hypothetical protein
MTEDELKKAISALVKRKKGLDVDGAEYAMLERVLNGLRYTYEPAGGIWESMDTDWGATPP